MVEVELGTLEGEVVNFTRLSSVYSNLVWFDLVKFHSDCFNSAEFEAPPLNQVDDQRHAYITLKNTVCLNETLPRATIKHASCAPSVSIRLYRGLSRTDSA